MPLLRFDMIEGKTEKEIKKILDATHEAVVDALDVPESDRYQVVHQHKAYELVIDDTGLGFRRDEDFVLISIVSSQRTEKMKVELYKQIAENLEEQCGIDKENVMINISENTAADWSFGNGEAQFLTGDL